jgi:hypothetical protein
MGTEWIPIFVGIPFAVVLIILGSIAFRQTKKVDDGLFAGRRLARAFVAAQGALFFLILIEEILWTGELSWLGFQRATVVFMGFGLLFLIVLAMFLPLLALLRFVRGASIVGVTVLTAAIGVGVAILADGTVSGGLSNGGLLGLAFAVGARLPWVHNFGFQKT